MYVLLYIVMIVCLYLLVWLFVLICGLFCWFVLICLGVCLGELLFFDALFVLLVYYFVGWWLILVVRFLVLFMHLCFVSGLVIVVFVLVVYCLFGGCLFLVYVLGWLVNLVDLCVSFGCWLWVVLLVSLCYVAWRLHFFLFEFVWLVGVCLFCCRVCLVVAY